MYAVIESGGKQYRVQPGEQLRVEKITAEPGSQVTFAALLVADGENIRVGTPVVDGAKVQAEIVAEEKGPKLRIFKYRRRKGYRRKTGHRQVYTALKILDITA